MPIEAWVGSDWNDPRVLRRRARLSHIVRRMQAQTNNGGSVGVPLSRLGEWRLDESPPTPTEQIDSLVQRVAEAQPSYANGIDLEPEALQARIGAPLDSNRTSPLSFLLASEQGQAWLGGGDGSNGRVWLRLKLAGWSRYEQLQHQQSVSRTAMIAMKFNDTELDGIVDEVFKPAVRRAGFELKRVTDGQLIDDQMRVALRTARFVVADLTHANNGAYWEAGFAEGLGRPVIYTCRADVLAKGGIHFDTNHMVTIPWDPEAPEETGRRLTATVRNTLPSEAVLTDG